MPVGKVESNQCVVKQKAACLGTKLQTGADGKPVVVVPPIKLVHALANALKRASAEAAEWWHVILRVEAQWPATTADAKVRMRCHDCGHSMRDFDFHVSLFLGDAMTTAIDWLFLAQFTGLAVVGIFAGVYLGRFIDGKRLKKGFGYFIMAMAVFIFTMEFII